MKISALDALLKLDKKHAANIIELTKKCQKAWHQEKEDDARDYESQLFGYLRCLKTSGLISEEDCYGLFLDLSEIERYGEEK